jgi:hypothetical protein
MTRSRILFSLLLAFASVPAFADFHLDVAYGRFPPTLFLTAVNANAAEAKDVRIRYASDVSQIITPVSSNWACTAGICILPAPLAPGASARLELRFNFTAPARKELLFDGSATINGTGQPWFVIAGAALYRSFPVTNTADSGAGSLRAAIDALNAEPQCADVPCAVDFALPEGSRIAILSPLPQIVARDVLVDGTGGTVALDGAAQHAGNGLDFARGDRAEVTGLTLRNFPDNAVVVRNRHRTTPFDATARLYVNHCRIEGNFRGISISPGWFAGGAFTDNVIAHNVRTGIFDWSEHDPGFPLASALLIQGNTISDNGASGIFLGEGSDGALVLDNVIERNRDFGLAIARGAINVRVRANSIAHNGNSAIDLGLDGPDRGAVTSRFGVHLVATVLQATYDPATNTTTVTGLPSVTPISTCDLCQTNIVSLFANDAAEHGQYSEAQTYLGDAQPNLGGFVFNYNGDLRGKYLTALTTLWSNLVGSNLYNAGELSKAFLVK